VGKKQSTASSKKKNKEKSKKNLYWGGPEEGENREGRELVDGEIEDTIKGV